MGQSLSQLLVHAIFSTKDRRSFLRSKELRNEIYAYMAGILKNLECHPIKIGGVEDHVHIGIETAEFGRPCRAGPGWGPTQGER
jgi:REP element-mobilizing transposase RayT